MTTFRSFVIRSFVVCFAVLAAHQVFAQAVSTEPGSGNVPPDEAYADRVPGVVYLQMRPGYPLRMDGWIASKDIDPIHKLLRRIGAFKIELFDKDANKDSISVRFGIDRMYTVYYSEPVNPIAVVVKALATGEVETASPRYIFKEQVIGIPNDPAYSEQYYMQNIHIEGAWNAANTMGDSSIVLADIDAGVNYNHEDLNANIQRNWAEGGSKATNGVDDDGDGVADDFYGYDAAGETTGRFLIPDGDPYPEDQAFNGASHGTMTTGCMVAVGNNHVGICGPAAGCKAYVVKIGNAQEQLTAAYEGLHWAAKRGNSKVLNNSWGGLVDQQGLAFASIFPQEVTARGEVMVAAAGNYSLDNDYYQFYPADMPGVLSVGATDEQDNPSSFTHYGRAVSVFAPGVNIKSTFYTTKSVNNDYAVEDGTSFSSPITSGVVGLVMLKHPKWSPKFVMRQIVATVDPIKNHNGDPNYSGRINAEKAMNAPGNPGIDISAYKINTIPGAPIDKVGTPTSISVDFHNYVDPGKNVFADLVHGAGYTYQNDPAAYEQLVGTIDSFQTVTQPFDVTRTGRFSEGSLKLNFYLHGSNEAGANYLDSNFLFVPLTKKIGMSSKVNTFFGTGVKQVDKNYAWASFGYYINARVSDPPPAHDTTIQVSSFSKRSADGTWSLPADIDNGNMPAYTMDAVDKDHAWFACLATDGSQPTVIYTGDGGSTFNSSDVSGIMQNVRNIHMFDLQKGIILGDAGAGKAWSIGITTDGGATWVPNAGPGGTANTATDTTAFGSSCWVGNKGWFGTSNQQIMTTVDGGSSWRGYTPANIGAKVKNCTAVGFADDGKTGYAIYRPSTNVASDGAALYYSQNGGVSWNLVSPPDAAFVAFGAAFIPGTTEAYITSNEGVFDLASPSTSPKWTTYLGAPSNWNPLNSSISASGTSTSYTVSANSFASGVVDYSLGVSAVQPAAPTTQSPIDLVNNAPNPVRDETTIYFRLAKADNVRIVIFDMLGREVSVVYNGELSDGDHSISVNASRMIPGVYRYAIESATGERMTKSFTIIR